MKLSKLKLLPAWVQKPVEGDEIGDLELVESIDNLAEELRGISDGLLAFAEQDVSDSPAAVARASGLIEGRLQELTGLIHQWRDSRVSPLKVAGGES